MEAFLMIMGGVMFVIVSVVVVFGIALAMLFTEYDVQKNGTPGAPTKV